MLNNGKFVAAAVLLSLLLLSLILGTVCLRLTEFNGTNVYTSSTTFWVYMAVAFAITFVLLVILLYMAYYWAACCYKPPVCVKPPMRRRSCAY